MGVQVRLGIVKMDGVTRVVCSLIQPCYFSYLRWLFVRTWKKDAAETLSERLRLEPWLIIVCMGSIVMQNVSAALLAGLSCMYQDIPAFTLGGCDHGFWTQ